MLIKAEDLHTRYGENAAEEIPATKSTQKLADEYDRLPLWQRLNWPHVFLLVLSPIFAAYGSLTTKIVPSTVLIAIIYGNLTGIGITGGYHRYWAHRSYKASPFLRIFLMLMGSSAVQGSILWWVRDHRVHHRNTDTEKDPYNAKKGLLFSHVGWMYRMGHTDCTDLLNDRLYKYYVPLSITMSLIFPALLVWLINGDHRGGWFYAGFFKMVCVHHSTFCINSLGHWLGDDLYDDEHTPRDHLITAFVALGEGGHSLHHQFPQDYRNGIRKYDWDPTKWFINCMYKLGQAFSLRMFSDEEFEKVKLVVQEKKNALMRQQLNWGVPIEQLPKYSMRQVEMESASNGSRKLIVVDGIVLDVTGFMEEHPGGSKLLKNVIGKDASAAVGGSMYKHSNAARNIMSHLRVGVISDDDQSQRDEAISF
ncbi:stearic acid desaturase [Ramicandelaber brevisporus]|nr:stearic acid desaturase [Ramicandelaber brevisporus]